jgi:arsenate reductase
VASAGSSPVGDIHPLTIKHLQLKGISVSNLKSKSWNDIESFKPEIVITVCDNAANEQCPLWSEQAIKVHWGLPDPTNVDNSSHETQLLFNQVMKTLENRIKTLLTYDLPSLSSDEISVLFNKTGEIS